MLESFKLIDQFIVKSRAVNQNFKDPFRISSYFQEFETFKQICEEYISNGLKDGTVSDRFVPKDAMLDV